MEHIADWFLNSDLSWLVIAVLSSNVITAIITGCFTCSAEKRKAKAKIQQIELEKQKEMEALHTKLEHERNENRRRAYAGMIESVTNYKSMHDIVHKSDAESSIHLYYPYAGNEEQPFLDSLLSTVTNSSPFDGPDQQATNALTKRIRDLQ